MCRSIGPLLERLRLHSGTIARNTEAMTRDAPSEPAAVPQADSATPAGAASRRQFSLSALMLAVLAVAVACAVVR